MSVLKLLLEAKQFTGNQQKEKLKEAFQAYPTHCVRSFRTHFSDLWKSLKYTNSDAETFFRYLYPEKINEKCVCGNPLKYQGPTRGYGYYCSVKCAGASDKVKEKRSTTNTIRYGAPTPLQCEEIKIKTQLTNLSRYGNICSAQGYHQSEARLNILRAKAPETVKKAMAIVKERYGVESAANLPQVKNARKHAEHIKWLEVKKPYQLNDLKTNFQVEPVGEITHRNQEAEWKHSCGHTYKALIQDAYWCRKCHSSARSVPEKELLDFVRSLCEAESGNRKVIAPYELDIFVPSKMVAIELNGAYWHRDTDEKQNIGLLKKTKLCNSVGIKLLHFWDYEWVHKRPIVKSIIMNALGLTPTKLNARDLIIDEKVSTNEARQFCAENHIQGYANASIKIGLRDKAGNLLQLLTAAKPRFNKTADLEIVRFCTKLNTNVRGGFSKIISRLGNVSILTYADLRFYNGNTYGSAGNFKFVRNTPPNYCWVKGDLVLPRYACQKSKLHKILPEVDVNKTEIENMQSNGWIKHSDCGSALFIRK